MQKRLGLLLILTCCLSQRGIAQQKPFQTLVSAGDEVVCVGFSADGKKLYAVSLDSYITLWDAKTWSRIRVIEPRPPAKAPKGEHQPEYRERDACALDGVHNELVVATGGDSIDRYQLSDGKLVSHSQRAANDGSLAFSRDGRWTAIGRSNNIELLSGNSSASSALLQLGGPVGSLSFSPTGKLLAVAVRGSGLQLWDVATKRSIAVLRSEGTIEQISFSEDERLVAAGVSEAAGARVWSVGTGTEIVRLPTAEGEHSLWGVAFSRDSRFLATLSGSELTVWNVKDWSRCSTSTTSGSYQLSFSRDGEILASGGGEEKVDVWQFRALAQCRTGLTVK